MSKKPKGLKKYPPLRISDLLCDDKTGRMSSVKLWFHIANIIASKIMLKLVDTNKISADIFGVYLAFVGGSMAGIYWIKRKYGNSANTESD